MAKGKLILICHYGGEFTRDGDGSQSYKGGEANAVNINSDTLFEDLKLNLAEMCNFEYKSVSAKYFLPGNTRTLINLGNDKDLIRLLNFHENSVTADIFIFGKEGFDRTAVKVDVASFCRASGVKVAETVTPGTASRIASVKRVRRRKSTDVIPPHSSDTDLISPDASANSYSQTISSSEPSNSSSDCYVPKTSRPSQSYSTTSVDMTSTPADSVKKRRRTAACKAIASDQTLSDDTAKRKSGTRNRKARRSTADMALDCDGVVAGSRSPSHLDDVPPGELVASWKKGIVGVGQEFKNVVEFREALRRYAVAHQFAYKFKKSDTNRVSCKCVAEGCPWRIYASRMRGVQTFRISKMVESHTCGGESRKSTQPTKDWLMSIVKERLRDAPHSKPKDIATSIAHDFGIQVKYYLVRLAMEDAKVQLMGSQTKAYNDLAWFCNMVVELNPGTFVKLVTDDDNRFQRLFLCFHALAFGFQNGCRPLLFLDSTSLRSKYHECVLLAAALDGNDGFFPLAIAVVDVVDEDSWIWFLEQLKAVTATSKNLTLVIDRKQLQKESILKVFENAHIGYSMFHLIESFKRNMKGPFYGDGRGSLVRCLTSAAHATRLERFKKCMDEMKQISPSSYEWLQQIEPEHWASAMFVGEQYNQIMENPTVPVSKLLEEAKAFPITRKIEVIVQMMSDLINARQMESSGWSTTLIPSWEETLHNQIIKSHKLKVLFSSECLFEVRDEYTNVVNVATKECTCGAWKDTGLPCCHAMAVFNCTGRNVYDYCPPFFTVDSYKVTYSKAINPLPEKSDEHSLEDLHVLPPNSSRCAGQDKVKQTNPKGPAKRIIVCALCQGAGHNKKTCKARPQQEGVQHDVQQEDVQQVQEEDWQQDDAQQVEQDVQQEEKSDEHSSEDLHVLPANSSRFTGQDEVKQTNPKGPAKRIIVFALCQGAGHKKKTCKARPQQEGVQHNVQQEGVQHDVQQEDVQQAQQEDLQQEVQQEDMHLV